MRKISFPLLALFAAAIVLSACSDSENNTENPSTETSRAIGFTIDLSQDWKAQQPGTRAVMERSPMRNLQMSSSDGSPAWLRETTRMGIDNPRSTSEADLLTRGAMIESKENMGNFSSYCYQENGTEVLANALVDNNGNFQEKKYWPEGNPDLSFYAFHPYSGSDISGSSSSKTYTFTVNPTVSSQEDLMYAATGLVGFKSGSSKQYVSLHFKHALTAVSFAYGSNYNDSPDDGDGSGVTSITLGNIYTHGKLTVDANGRAQWERTGEKGSITCSFTAPVTPRANKDITTGNLTFLMIPQDLKDVTVTIVDCGKTKTMTFKDGTWDMGTTKNYEINSTKDESSYVFTVTDPETFAYNETAEKSYSVTSYSTPKGGGSNTPVRWKVTKYEYSDDNGATWISCGSDAATRPDWVNKTFTTTNNGDTPFTESVSGQVSVNAASADAANNMKTIRDNLLKSAAEEGSSSGYKDLSLDADNKRSTANCYLISARGYYKIPLVHGNMICKDTINVSAVGKYGRASTFVDYKGNQLYDAESPLVWLKNGPATGDKAVGTPTSAEVVWNDISLEFSSSPESDNNVLKGLTVEGDYLKFQITDKIQQGNAVVAVKDGSGVVMWSWHLWFAPAGALGNNGSGSFSSEPLGMVYDYSSGTSYSVPRKYRAQVTQDKSGKVSYIVVTQNPGVSGFAAHTALYQWGRKDAFPGTKSSYDSNGIGSVYGTGFEISTDGAGTNHTYPQTIKNPGTFYKFSSSNYLTSNDNSWSANRGTSGTSAHNLDVVKTVYDPSPAGYHLPKDNAWVGLSTTSVGGYQLNSTTNMGGRYFTQGTLSVFFPAAGVRSSGDGLMGGAGSYGDFWSAVLYNTNYGYRMLFNSSSVYPQNFNSRASGFSVCPVQE